MTPRSSQKRLHFLAESLCESAANLPEVFRLHPLSPVDLNTTLFQDYIRRARTTRTANLLIALAGSSRNLIIEKLPVQSCTLSWKGKYQLKTSYFSLPGSACWWEKSHCSIVLRASGRHAARSWYRDCNCRVIGISIFKKNYSVGRKNTVSRVTRTTYLFRCRLVNMESEKGIIIIMCNELCMAAVKNKTNETIEGKVRPKIKLRNVAHGELIRMA